MADERFTGQKTEDISLLKILLTLKQNIMRDLHVASCGIVKSISTNEIMVQCFPLVKGMDQKTISCLKACNDILNEGDIVLVLFTDKNTIQNLKQAKSRQKLTELSNDEELHSENFGLVIQKIDFNEEEE